MSTEDVPLRTEWKQAEAEQRRLVTIVVDSNDAVTVQDFEGQLTAWRNVSIVLRHLPFEFSVALPQWFGWLVIPRGPAPGPPGFF